MRSIISYQVIRSPVWKHFVNRAFILVIKSKLTMLNQTQRRFPRSYFHSSRFILITLMTLLIKGPNIYVHSLLISEDVSIKNKVTDISINSSITEENLVLTRGQGMKLKEIRKLARLAGHEQPEHITEVDPKVCYKDDCLKAAKEFFISMDFSLEPCHDWRKYSCEWRTLSSNTALNQQTDLLMKADEQFKAILLDSNSEKHTIRLAQLYYEACKAWFEDISKVGHIKNYIDKLGNWPLLSGKTGGEGEWLKVLSEILRIVPDNVTPFLMRLEAIEVDGSDRVLLQIDSGSTQIDFDSDDIHDLLQILRRKPTTPVSRKAEAIAIQDFKESMKTLSAVTFDAGSSGKPTAMTLKDIQEKLTKDVPSLNLNIQTLIQSIVQGTDLKIIPETEVLTDYDSLVEYVKAVNSLDPAAITNLLYLQLAIILIGDATSVIEDNSFLHMENYRRIKFRSPSLHCLKETAEVFPYAISEEYITRHPQTVEARQLANTMVGHLKNGFMEIISSIPWLDGKAKDMIREKITKVEALVAYPSWIENEELVAAYHKNINLNERNNSSGTYVSYRISTLSWLSGKYWKTKLNDEKLNGWNYIDRNGFVGETIVEYIPSLNQIRIPTGILQPPMFSADFPGYMNFGGLGSVIARQLAQIFDSNGIYTNSQGEYGVWLDDKNYKSYMEWARRIQNDWEEDDMTLNNKIRNILAYHITVKGYEEHLKSLKGGGREEIKLPGLSVMDPLKLLHLKFTNVLCESVQIKGLRTDVDKDQRQSCGSEALYLVSRTSHFSNLFGCDVDHANSALDIP